MKKGLNLKKIFKTKGKMRYIAIAIAVLLLIALFSLVVVFFRAFKDPEPEIVSQSTLERIINVSDLSTFEAVYNGIAEVNSEDNPEEVDYYVSYEARVKAGLDFGKVNIDIDNEKKVITVKLPQIELTDINVDIASLDYIFMDEDANTSTVSEEAYKECINDVENETNTEDAIYELAEQNAHNIIEALISPFVEQLDEEYELVIN